MKAGF